MRFEPRAVLEDRQAYRPFTHAQAVVVPPVTRGTEAEEIRLRVTCVV